MNVVQFFYSVFHNKYARIYLLQNTRRKKKTFDCDVKPLHRSAKTNEREEKFDLLNFSLHLS